MEGANHQRKSERKQTTSSVGSAGLSSLARGSGRGIAAGRAASRTSGGMATAASTMLRDERMAQNKKPKYITSRGILSEYYCQYPVMQGSKEGKHANL